MTTWNDRMIYPKGYAANHWRKPAREEAKRYIKGLLSYDEDVPTMTITTDGTISPELRKLLIGDD